MKKILNIKACTFYNEETGYTVLKCDEVNEWGRAITCSISCTGYYLPRIKNRTLKADVEMQKNKYGESYLINKYEMPDPTDKEGIIEMIIASKLKGIGRVKASKIYEAFKGNTLKVLDENFDEIKKIKGIPNDLTIQKKQWSDTRDVREILTVLGNNLKISFTTILKIKNRFKEEACMVIKQKPYSLTEIRGIDFEMADQIAKQSETYHYSYNSDDRIKAGIKQVLLNAMTDGNLYLRTEQLLSDLSKLLNDNNVSPDNAKMFSCLAKMARERSLAVTTFNAANNDYAWYLDFNYLAEEDTAMKLATMLSSKADNISEDKLRKILDKEQQDNGIKLAKCQKEAVINSLKENVSIITGGPGRGKTTVLNMILRVYKSLYPKNNIVLLAPTGIAARRIKESTGCEAYTFHSFFNLSGEEEYKNISLQVDADLIIVDETSMVDMKIMAILINRIKPTCKLIFVGDKDQLNSVGAGNVFTELINSGMLPTYILDTPFRQSANDLIYINAERINSGNKNLLEGISFKFIEKGTVEEIQKACIDEYKKVLKAKTLDSVFLLSPFKRKTGIGTNAINDILQAKITGKVAESVEMYGKKFTVGDKVMHLKNTSEDLILSNGDIGYVIAVKSDESERSVTVRYAGVGEKTYETSEDIANLELAYAMTIHKSQGNETDTVIIPVAKCFRIMMKRNLIYTAVSRAKKQVIIIGDKEEFLNAINATNYNDRNTLLGWRIKKNMQFTKTKKVFEPTEKVTTAKEPEYKQLSFA